MQSADYSEMQNSQLSGHWVHWLDSISLYESLIMLKFDTIKQTYLNSLAISSTLLRRNLKKLIILTLQIF